MTTRLPALCLRLGIVYLLAGIVLGTVMGMREDFTFMPVHAHLNLLGFVSTFLVGLFLKIFPETLERKSARRAVVAILVTVPLLLVFLAVFYAGFPAIGPLLGIGSFLVLAAYAAFAVEVFRITKK